MFDENTRILMDIQALQNFGTVQSALQQSNESSTLFSTMLGEILANTQQSFNQNGVQNPLMYTGTKPIYIPSSANYAQSIFTETKKLESTLRQSGQQKNNFEDIIQRAAEKYKIPARLISSIVKHESNFNPKTVSHAGAQGLMQLMPGTARYLGVQNSFDPEQNIDGGARYLKQMLDQFNGDYKLALAAYNAGPGNVKKYGGIPPFKETQNYVKKVLNSFYA